MADLMHVVLHLTLCASTGAHGVHRAQAVHVKLTDAARYTAVNKTYKLDPDESPYDSIIEFDATRGDYVLTVTDPKSTCGAAQYIVIIPGGNRSIPITMKPGGIALLNPTVTLFAGLAPAGASYAQPTFVLFPDTLKCGDPVGDPIPMDSTTESDYDSYYESIFSFSPPPGVTPMTVLRLTTNTGDYHYIRARIPLPTPEHGQQNTMRFDIDQDALMDVVGKPPDTLLCPKLWKTEVHNQVIQKP